jgi:hypothetical protein
MNTSNHRRRRLLARVAIGTFAFVVVAAAAWWALQPSTVLVETAQASPHASHAAVEIADALPPPRTALVDTFDVLKSRADQGDAHAASRLYNDLLRCRVSVSINNDVAQLAKSTLLDRNINLPPQELDAREKKLAHMQELADAARSNQSLCLGVSAAYLQELEPATLRAAELGDDDAASCYVNGDFLSMPGAAEHPEWIAQYRQHALDIADQSVGRGNWTMVRQFYDALGDGKGATPFGRLTGRDIAQQYRYARLMQFGADGPDNGAINVEIDALLPSLSENDIAVGDIWARNTYQHAFASHPQSHALLSANVCQMRKD